MSWRFMLTAAWLILTAASTLRADEPPTAVFQRAFHIAGIPGLKGQQRIDVTLDPAVLTFRRGKFRYEVLYSRMRLVSSVREDRVYEKTSYAAGIATFGAGFLWILRKHPMDAIVLEYENERSGRQGLVFQVEKGDGIRMIRLLQQKGVNTIEPIPTK